MVRKDLTPSPERVAIMQWTARIGAVTAEALADRLDVSVASAQGRLQALQKVGWLSRKRPLAEQPALFTATRAGLRVAALQGLDPCRVSASNAHHLIVCAWVAAALERCYPDHAVLGERELRRDERERGGVALASARLGIAPDGGPLLHRPDLVLWPREAGGVGAGNAVDPVKAVDAEGAVEAQGAVGTEGAGDARDTTDARETLDVQDARDVQSARDVQHARDAEHGACEVELPVAVEVELTVKAPQRLAEICRAWARCRCVAGVLYLAPPEVRRALERALEQVEAGERIAVLGLDAVPRPEGAPRAEIASSPDRGLPPEADVAA